MGLWKKIASQFGKPSGLSGRLAGFIMATRSSNIERCHWAISLLDLRPADRVLEIGFGPGIGIERMAQSVTEGTVWGIDHSDVMLKQAAKRNRKAVQSGRVKLSQNSVSNLPEFPEPFDKMLSINSYQFWDHPGEAIKDLKDRLRPGGILALVHQPRQPGARDEDAAASGNKIAATLRDAGFTDIRTEFKKMKPVSTVCVIAKN